MCVRCAAWVWVCVLLGLAASASAAPADPPAGVEPPPDEMLSLHLTDLQRRVLEQVFHRCEFETPPSAAGADLAVRVEPTAPGGLYRMGPDGDLPARLTVTVRSAARNTRIELAFLAQDFYGRKVASGAMSPVFPDAAGQAAADLVLKDTMAFGYYHVLVTATVDGRSATGACGLAMVQPFQAGPDPKSPFGLAAPPGKMPDLAPEICRRLGVRHLAMDWTDNEAALESVRGAGLVATPIVRFDIPQKSPEPANLVATMGEVIQRYAQTLPDWQIGRRPVFADWREESVKSYREVISGLIGTVRRNKTPATLWVTATPQVLADVLTEGPVLAGADGVGLCVAADAAAPNLRSGAYRRSLDYGIQVAKRMGAGRAVVADTGDESPAGGGPAAVSPQQQAWKLVTRHVLSLAAGAERVYIGWGRGIPAPLPSAAAYAWMTHLLDGATYQGSPWPDVPLLEAHLFAGLERRVAVVWSWAGADPANCDRGALVFDDGAGLEALDVMGHPVGIWKGPRLIVPLGEAPVYIVSGELKIDQLRDRLRGAGLLGVAPATISIQNIIRGEVPGRVNVTLWVQSHRPRRLDGIAGLLVPEGWRARQTKERFSLDPGQAREVTIECDVSAAAAPPPYTIEAVASVNEEYVRHTQSVWPAQPVERTIEVGYGLGAWEDIPPVVLASLSGDVRAEVRTAWDAKNFYFSAAVRRERATFQAGRFASEGDVIQLAWGADDRADDDFGHRTRDRALPAGALRDTDHLMVLVFTPDGAKVIRLRGPRMVLRSHVPGNLDPVVGPVEGAAAEIARDQPTGRTLFEAAIPWKALAPLKGERGRILRFGFRIGDGTKAPLEWSRAAGVPDFLANPASFLPASLEDGLPCQTWWGMVGQKKK